MGERQRSPFGVSGIFLPSITLPNQHSAKLAALAKPARLKLESPRH